MIEDLRIELIDDDPSAFGPVGAAPPPMPRPRWVVPAAVLACLALAVVGLVVWQPWHHDPEPPLSNRLALGSQPSNEVLSVMIDAAWVGPSAGEVGLVYADADAVFPRLRKGEGRSLRADRRPRPGGAARRRGGRRDALTPAIAQRNSETPSSSARRTTVCSGRPITLLTLPSIFSTNTPPMPCTA